MNYCKNKNTKHLAKRGRLHCRRHFRSGLKAAENKIRFVFDDTYSQPIERVMMDALIYGQAELRYSWDRERGDLYIQPVVLSKHGFNYA